MAIGQNIIEAYGISWRLIVGARATLSYDHPAFGLLQYTGESDWLCDNVNTLHLTSKGSLPDGVLPLHVCVRPRYDGGCGCYDLNTYNPPEDKAKCCDPECPIIKDLWFECNGVRETCTATFTVGGGNGLEGVCSPSGPTYGGSCTLATVLVEVNYYCAGGQWMADVYNTSATGPNAGVRQLCQSCIPITHECCPLRLGDGVVDTPCDVECDSGGGVTTDCCPDDEVPSTLTASFGPNTETPGCDEGTAEGTTLSLVYDSVNEWWDGSTTTDTGNLGLRIWCDAGTWMGEPRCNGTAANSPSPLTLVSCAPFEATTTATFGASCGGCTESATEITQTYLITITA